MTQGACITYTTPEESMKAVGGGKGHFSGPFFCLSSYCVTVGRLGLILIRPLEKLWWWKEISSLENSNIPKITTYSHYHYPSITTHYPPSATHHPPQTTQDTHTTPHTPHHTPRTNHQPHTTPRTTHYKPHYTPHKTHTTPSTPRTTHQPHTTPRTTNHKPHTTHHTRHTTPHHTTHATPHTTHHAPRTTHYTLHLFFIPPLCFQYKKTTSIARKWRRARQKLVIYTLHCDCPLPGQL